MRQIRPDEPCPCRSGAIYSDCHMDRRLATSPEAIKRRIRLRVIPEPDPETRAVFQKLAGATDSLLFTGSESTDAYVCGSCYTPLVVGTPLTQLQNLVLRCSQCGRYNEAQAAGPIPRQPVEQVSRRQRRSRHRR